MKLHALHLLAVIYSGRSLRIVDFEAPFRILLVFFVFVIPREGRTAGGLKLLLV